VLDNLLGADGDMFSHLWSRTAIVKRTWGCIASGEALRDIARLFYDG